MRVLFIFLVTSQIVYGCGYDDFTAPGKTAEPDIIPNTDIGYVRFLCGNGSGIVADDIVVGGYVTANDKSGNIYRSFFIEDGTGALEVRAGMYSLHNVYVRGRYVAVKLSGLTVSIYNGTLQAGLSVGENGVGAGYIDNWAVAADYLHTWSDYGNLEPLSIRVPEFSEDSSGRLIRQEGMKFIQADATQL
ncbi:MAG: DUF5689 domain-containing protein [Rikenellaceae bacterium]|nr:DUF5689 domain-containing protein [Rikenellaceae bacterium]